MYKTTVVKLILLTLLLSLAGACAKISTPTGGPTDKTPPVVVKSLPVDGTRNFKGKEISITFDEYVTLDNISDKFMVSPPMKKKPRVFIKGKNVNVEFEEKLKDSTTYTLYFLDAIRDLNANNILDNFQFVFSTGPVIDSLSVTGNVFNSFTLENPEKTQVLLYRNTDDSAVIKNFPDYISRVVGNGYFRFDHVAAGKYRLFALKDDDNSKNYNRTEEQFAFMDSLITITPGSNYLPAVKDTTTVKKDTKVKETSKAKTEVKKPAEPVILTGQYRLLMFLAKKKDHYLSGSSRPTKYMLTYVLSLPPDTMKVDFSIKGFSADKYIIEKSRQKDTLTVWLTDSTLYRQSVDTTYLTYPFTDSLGIVGYRTDTIPMRFTVPPAPRKAKIKKAAFAFRNNFSSGFLKPGESIYFGSETPFRQPDTTLIRLYEIKDSVKLKLPYKFVRDSSNYLRYNLNAKIIQGKKYLIIARKGAFGNIYSEESDSIGTKFSVKDPDLYGKLTYNISNCTGDVIIQLLNSSEKIISQVRTNKNGKFVFPLLETGLYRARVIYDNNNDGFWTTGDYILHRQPEAVSYYPTELDIKADYFLDQDWDIKMTNFKDIKLKDKSKK
jgi:hypothetical protein